MSASLLLRRPSLAVLTVDDHPLVRAAVGAVLGLMAERVELLEAATPPEGLAVLERRPDLDLVLLDVNFAGHDGLAFVPRFRAAAPATPLMVYTMHEDLPTLKEALACGAAGIVPKTHSAALLQKAIELVMSGGIYVPAEMAHALSSPEAGAPAMRAGQISGQQWRLLELLARGLPNKTIARELGLAPSTVKNQLTVLFGRLNVCNRTQAAIAARGLLKSKPPGL
jgi:DNA-binding NarL/FixJ family response regulator